MSYENARFSHRADFGDRGPVDILRWKFGLMPADDHAARPRWPGIPVADPGPTLARERGPLVTWFGHASALVRLAGLDILIDPVEGSIPLVKRQSPPAPILLAVPRPSAVVVTHNHFDHMDATTLLKLPRSTPMFVPLGLGPWFAKNGFERVTELDWWQRVEFEGVVITYLPARHWSKRSFFDTLETLWGGYMIQSPDFCVYHAGDSGWFGGFAEIGKRFDRIDVAMLPIGAYAPRWFMEPSHITPEEAVRAATVVGARNLIPIHYGSFVLSDEPLTEPPAMLEKAAEEAGFDRARILPAGGTWLLDSEKAV